MTDGKPTKVQYKSINQMIAAMQRFEWDMHNKITREGRVPSDWREVWQKRTARKKRVTFWMDEDVLKLFRSMGPGYGPRMNDVLRSFMFARLAGILEGEDLLETARENWMGKAKPSVAEISAQLEAMRGGTLD